MQLYNEQKDALRKLRSGSILNGGVGSGKSITALAYYCKRYGGDAETLAPFDGSKHPLYIITTAQKRDLGEWKVELAKIGVNENDSYGRIRYVIDSWQNIKKYIGVRNAFFIFDEQRLVGKGAWVDAFLKIQKNNDWIMLSATPGDCWLDYIPVFIANGFYRNRTAFIREHVVYEYRKKYPVVRMYLNEKKLERYRNQILVEMSVHKNAEKHFYTKRAQYDKEVYSVIRTRRNPYDGMPVRNISQYCALQRFCVNTDPSRQRIVSNLLQAHDRAIIFYNFDYELELLRALPRKSKTGYGEWNGHRHDSVPKTKRWTYLVQYMAGSEGWECPSCDTIIFYSGTYSYRTFVQACGRIDRVNTKYKDLYYYSIYSTASIDARIQTALKAKRNFNILDARHEFELAGHKNRRTLVFSKIATK